MKLTPPLIILSTMLISMLLTAGCASNKIKKESKFVQKFIKQYNYVPFDIPRDGDGVGTLISYTGKTESVIAGKTYCLSTLPVDTLSALLPDFDYIMDGSGGVQLDASKLFDGQLDVKAALKLASVKKIKLAYKAPYEIRIERLRTTDLIKQSSKKPEYKSCFESMYKKGNFLIERVVGARAIEFTLLTANNEEVALTAEILTQINAGVELKNNFTGKTTISSSKPFIIGYRIWSIAGESALFNGEVKLVDVSVAETQKFKTK